MKNQVFLLLLFSSLFFTSCGKESSDTELAKATVSSKEPVKKQTPKPQHTLTKDQTHNKFSKNIPPILRVKSGAVIEAFTEEASDEQIHYGDDASVLATLEFDPIHPLTGPVYVENAQPGDVLKVTLHEIELQDWGWTAILPGFSFLAERFQEPYLKNLQNKNRDKPKWLLTIK